MTPDAAISQDDVACSVCHHEHHGAMANLSDVTDQRCQTCHSKQFGSFATSHPPFEDYPPQANHTIAFDHARHANLHFPKVAVQNVVEYSMFDCRSCHAVQSNDLVTMGGQGDPIITTLPFEVACVSCHDESLKVQVANGPALIALPTLPREVASRIEGWPEGATGSPDGELSAWMRLLLAGQNPELDLEGMHSFGLVDWASVNRQAQAVAIGTAIRQLAIDLSVEGQTHLKQLAIQAGADEAAASTLARSFQPQLLRDAVQDWFGGDAARPIDRFSQRRSGTHATLAAFADDDLLTDWSKEADPLTIQPETSEESSGDWRQTLSDRFDASKTQSLGGWYRDDLTMSLRYRGTGHSDEVLRSLIDMSQSHPDYVVKEPAVAACVECHQNGRWSSSRPNTIRDRLTKFTHRPHLDIQGLQDCQHCHQMRDSDRSNSELEEIETAVASLEMSLGLVDRVMAKPEAQSGEGKQESDFKLIQKETCAACHTAKAAGDRCTTCHRYHVGVSGTDASSR